MSGTPAVEYRRLGKSGLRVSVPIVSPTQAARPVAQLYMLRTTTNRTDTRLS